MSLVLLGVFWMLLTVLPVGACEIFLAARYNTWRAHRVERPGVAGWPA